MTDITYRFNRQDLVDGIQHIHNTRIQLDDDIANCNAAVDNLTANWVGQDKQEAENHRFQWNQAAQKIHDCLNNAETAAKNILDNYDSQEATTAARWAR